MPDPPADALVVGRVVRAHGIHGSVIVSALTDQPRFEVGRTVLLDDGTELEIRHATPYKGKLLVAFTGVSDRSGAEALRRRTLLIRREDAGEPPVGSVWAVDLEGLPVRRPDGTQLGVVAAVLPNPAHDILVVRDPEDREFQIPMVSAFLDPLTPGATEIVARPIPGLVPE